MTIKRDEIRLSLPSKGRIADDALSFLDDAGLRVHKPNPRQFEASIPALPGLCVLFQRAGDIVVSVRDGSVDFGISGWDVVRERAGEDGAILPLHKELGFSRCTLDVIVPEQWTAVQTMADLRDWGESLGRPLRVATKFPNLTGAFLSAHGIENARLIDSEGTLEVAPAIGYADLISDLVSTGTTLRDNRLRRLDGGVILRSQACLIANRAALTSSDEVMGMAKTLLEYIEAHLRAATHVAVFANMRGDSPRAIAEKMFSRTVIGGLQGPTISPVITREGEAWFAVHIIVARDRLADAIAELRQIGGSGVVVGPVTYIFEEEPEAYKAMLRALEE